MSHRQVTWPVRLSRYLSWAVFALGGVVLLGWAFDLALLKSGSLRSLSMVPNTALGFFLSGLALVLTGDGSRGGWPRTLAKLAASGVVMIGGITLSQYALDWDSGLDRWLFREKVVALGQPFAGRPAVLAAISLLMMGVALLIMDLKRVGGWCVDLLALIPIQIALLALIGYACDVPSFYTWNSQQTRTAMALNTAVGFVLLGVAVHSARPDRGLALIFGSGTAGGLVARRLLLAPVLIPLVTGLIRISAQHQGLLNSELAGWVFSFLNIFVFTAIIWWIATRLYETENRSRAELNRINSELEQRVAARTAELEQAQESLREKEERLRLIIDTALDAVVTINVRGEVIGWNHQAQGIFGWKAEEILGLSLSNTIIPPAHRPGHEAGLRRFAETGGGRMQNRRIEMPALCRDGREILIELAITPLRIRQELMFSAFIRDITELRKSEAALRRVERRYRALIEHSADSITLIDAQNIILYASPSVAMVEGYAPEELIGRNGLENTHPEDLPLVQQYVREILANPGQPVPVLWRRRHKDGRWLWLEGVATNLLEDPAVRAIVTNYRDITARKEADERAAWLASFPELNPNPVFELDLATRCVHYANPSALRLFPELASQGIQHFLLEGLEAQLAELIAGTKAVVRREVGMAGQWFAQTITYVAGHRLRVYASEVTERREAEQELARESQLLRAVMDNLPDYIYLKDAQKRFVLLNASNSKLMGGTAREHWLGRTVFDFFPEEQARVFDEDDERVLRSGQPVLGREEPISGPDGQLRHLLTTKVPFHDPDGQVVGLLGISHDITERKQQESRVILLNRRLQELIATVQRIALARDVGGIMAAVRGAARQLTDADGASFVLRDGEHSYYADEDAISPLWKGQRFPLNQCLAGWVILNHQPVVIEDVYADPRVPKAAYQKTFIKSLVMVPIRTQNPLGAIGAYWAKHHVAGPDEQQLLQTLADATAIALENIQLYQDMEGRVSERTAQLQAANKELEAFSYSVSHDLRAPLRSVDGFSQAVLEDFGPQLPEEGRRYLQIIREGAQRMGLLIDDLLTFSRLSRLPLNKRPVNMTELVWVALQELEPQREGRRIRINVAELPAAEGDPALLKQVWLNLLSNAIKYTLKRHEAVVDVGTEMEGGQRAYFVRDNGTGFDMQYAHKLFGVFQRLHRMEDYPGTGVGLAIVQRVIHRHGGRVWARAEEDRGAEFCFTLEGGGTES